MAGEFSLDRTALVRAFDRAAAHYDSALPPLQRLNAELLERLRFFDLKPQYILDLGAGTCQASLPLRQHYPGAQVLALDLSLPMLRAAPRPWWPRARFQRVSGDAVRLPFRDHSVDLVYSNLLLPFCDQPHRVFLEVARVLRQGGLFLFSSLGPDTLQELRAAWASVDGGAHVSEFPNLPQLGDALMHAGLIEPVMDTEQLRLYYPNVQALMRELKAAGAHSAIGSRRRALTGRGRLKAMADAYESVRTPQGLPASFETLFGAAFAGARMADDETPGSNEVAVPVSSVRKHVRS
jgi:malonyl-CoA O-methyltransferase